MSHHCLMAWQALIVEDEGPYKSIDLAPLTSLYLPYSVHVVWHSVDDAPASLLQWSLVQISLGEKPLPFSLRSRRSFGLITVE